jgi:peroxiredoxin
MKAWEEAQKTAGTIVTMMGDPSGAFTAACDMEMTHPGPISVGIIGRCKRWAMLVKDGQVKAVNVAGSEFDPAGDDFPEKTLAPALIAMAAAAAIPGLA